MSKAEKIKWAKILNLVIGIYNVAVGYDTGNWFLFGIGCVNIAVWVFK